MISKVWKNGDYLTADEWNRLLNNCTDVAIKWGIEAPTLSRVTFTSRPTVAHINTFVEWINNAVNVIYGTTKPSNWFTPTTITNYSPVWTEREINGIESDLQILYETSLQEVSLETSNGAVLETSNGEPITANIIGVG